LRLIVSSQEEGDETGTDRCQGRRRPDGDGHPAAHTQAAFCQTRTMSTNPGIRAVQAEEQRRPRGVANELKGIDGKRQRSADGVVGIGLIVIAPCFRDL
jgi:hypothetical protein